MPKQSPDTLRVAILGDAPDAADWAASLAGRGMEVHHVNDVASLGTTGAGLAVIFADCDRATTLTAELAGQPARPPVLLVVDAPADGPHPHTRLVKSLLTAKNEWERTFDAIVDPVALLDRSGTVRRANLCLAKALGRPILEIVSQPYAELLGAVARERDPIAMSLSDGEARTQETRFAHLPGVQQVTTSPYVDTEGRLVGLVVILKDVNDLKEQQERLLQAARLADIGQLAAGVAHEINTPLASIALRAESLLRAASDPQLLATEAFKNFPRYLKTIDEEIFRCKKIIAALLEFSRARKPETHATDLNSLTERAADLVGHQMKLRQVSLTLNLDPAVGLIPADDGQLRQALIALLMNALDATSPGGRVEIATRRDAGGTVTVSVADTGSGIAREHLDKIFSPFFTTKPLGQGTGLGLAICHGIVTSHGGEIRVESEVGVGTRVSMLLPAPGGPASA